jgi:hypothetical protein
MNAVLADRQSALQHWLRAGDPAIGAHVAASPPAAAAARLRVYADAYRLRLVEVLTNDFPVLTGHVGRARMEAMASAYLRDHPSTQPSVRHLGRGFAQWLSARRDVEATLVELARFEWAQGEVFDACDASPVTVAEVGALPAAAWPTLSLFFQPALRCLWLETTAPAQVAAHAAGQPPTALAAAAPGHWLLWRQDFNVHWRRLPSEEADALRDMRDGQRFGALCTRLQATHGLDAPARAAGLLKRWLQDGLITALHAETPAIPSPDPSIT